MANHSDRCVFSRFYSGKGTIICVYVDGIVILGTGLDIVKSTKRSLCQILTMTPWVKLM